MQSVLITAYKTLWLRVMRPLIFLQSAQDAHERMLTLLLLADRRPWLGWLLGWLRGMMQPSQPVTVGGVTLHSPLMLAAGFVKGDGFEDEAAALLAVKQGRNIMPGWRTVPRMVGLVEFGSFTRWPRVGNPGTVVWRDEATSSTQNRVGLKNPGVKAAAAFLAARHHDLPPQFGINIAVSPGVDDPDQQVQEVRECLAAFIAQGIRPAWFTVNLSCPNTEDDPGGNQTAELAERVCGGAVDYLRGVAEGDAIPLWVKISPGLAVAQYQTLQDVFSRIGVQAIIVTNTMAHPTPDDPSLVAGVGGGRLHHAAVEAVSMLTHAPQQPVDLIACGGVQDGVTFNNYRNRGVQAAQYWSALVFRGPLAAAVILAETT